MSNEFDLFDIDIDEQLKDDSFVVIGEPTKVEAKKKTINRVSDMTQDDKVFIEKIIRFNYLKGKNSFTHQCIDDSNYNLLVEKCPNSKIVELLIQHVGLSEVIAYNLVTMHRYNLCVNPHYRIFAFKNKSTFTKTSQKHLF
jgi:hypothetical protein